MSLVLDTGAMKYRESPTDPWRPLVIKAGMNWESMADTYDPDNGTYEVGQYVLEDGMMYRCIYEITTPEAWTPAHWTSTNVADELASFIIISDDQPTEDSNKIWIAETTSPFGVQIPTMDDHNALENTLTQLDSAKAAKVDLTNISQTSPTCTVQNGIPTGTYFYLDGVLARAKTLIGNGADFTEGTNYDEVTAGGLNEFNNSIATLIKKSTIVVTTDTDGDAPLVSMPAGRVFVSAVPNRTYGDGTYSSWFGVIIGCGVNNVVSAKCVNDSNQKLASQKVAIDLYYIDGQQLS